MHGDLLRLMEAADNIRSSVPAGAPSESGVL
jgi:hypothetical protein